MVDSVGAAAGPWAAPRVPAPRPVPAAVRAMALALVALFASDVAVVVARAGEDHHAPVASTLAAQGNAPLTAPPVTSALPVATDLAAALIPPPPGYVEVSAGVNGAVSTDQLATFANLGLDAAHLPSGLKGSELEDVHIRAYGHTWANQAQGRVLVVIVVEFTNPRYASAADEGAREAMGKLPAAAPFATSGVPKSYGVGFDEPAAGAGTVHIRGVFFTKGSRLAVVDLGGLRELPSAEETTGLAKAQYDRL